MSRGQNERYEPKEPSTAKVYYKTYKQYASFFLSRGETIFWFWSLRVSSTCQGPYPPQSTGLIVSDSVNVRVLRPSYDRSD